MRNVHVQLGQIMDNKIQKKPNPTAASEELGAKPEYSACHHHSITPKTGQTS